MPTTNLTITCRASDRRVCAAFTYRATRRAGTGRIRAAMSSLRVLAAGSATVTLRRPDAVMYLALARGLTVDDALYVQRVQAALATGAV